MSDATPGKSPGQSPGQTPASPPFAMVGDAEAPVCVDGVCEVAPPSVDRAPAEDA